MSRLPSHLVLLAVIALVRCSVNDLTGGGSDLPDKVVMGYIFSTDKRPASATQVTIIPADYNAAKDSQIPVSFTDTTDSSGAFQIRVRTKGDYTLQAVHLSRRTRLLITGVTVGADTTRIAADTLRIPGVVKAYLPEGIDPANCWLYIPGTTIAARSSTAARYAVLDSVPAGKIPAVCFAARGDPAPTAIRYNCTVPSGDTAFLAKPAWKFSRSLRLNTAVSGAQVTGTVMHFPVLVRLTGDNFDFSQAKAGGEDLYFTKADTASLPYEIERWDATGRRAELWVNVDTVHGNDSTQFITMYWGNPGIAGSSNGAAVFDTTTGFAAVWHLDDNADSIRDATADAFNGMNAGAADTAGIIGNARKFSNGNFIKVRGLLREPASVTLSAWVRSDKTTGQDIISLGDAVLIRFDDVNLTTAGCFHDDSVADDQTYAIVGSGRYLAKTGWHFLAFSIDASAHSQTFYIDGIQSTVAHYANPISYAGLGTDTYIGVHGNGKTTFNFVGHLDEVRVSDITLTSDWIKLCYMNQKSQDALVQW